MKRPGVMAPPDLYELPAQPGLMSPHPRTPAHELDLRAILWTVALALAVVELCLELATP